MYKRRINIYIYESTVSDRQSQTSQYIYLTHVAQVYKTFYSRNTPIQTEVNDSVSRVTFKPCTKIESKKNFSSIKFTTHCYHRQIILIENRGRPATIFSNLTDIARFYCPKSIELFQRLSMSYNRLSRSTIKSFLSRFDPQLGHHRSQDNLD